MLKFTTQEHQQPRENACALISARSVPASCYHQAGKALLTIVRRAGDRGYRASRILCDHWRRPHSGQSIWTCTTPLHPGGQGGRISAARPVMAPNVVHHRSEERRVGKE